MSELLDFDRIARQLLELGIVVDDTAGGRMATSVALAYIREQLRLAWNARGTADLAAIIALLPPKSSPAYVNTVKDAIGNLDR